MAPVYRSDGQAGPAPGCDRRRHPREHTAWTRCRPSTPAPVDVPIDAFNVYQPDVVVFRAPLADDQAGGDAGPPLLVVEVASPSTAARDRRVKRVRLLDAGVDEVWLVDPHRDGATGGVLDVYDRARDRDVPRRATGTVAIESTVLPGFSLVPATLFEA